MNHFALFAHGPSFDPDTFLRSTPLQFDGLWRKGERGGSHPASSGVRKILGDGEQLPIDEQERIAIDFLVAHAPALQALVHAPGVTTRIVGVQYHVQLEDGTVGLAIQPSPLLLSYAVDAGFEVIYYVTFARSEPEE